VTLSAKATTSAPAMGCLSAVACAGDLDFVDLPFLAKKFLGRKSRRLRTSYPRAGPFWIALLGNERTACAGTDVALQLHGFLEMALNERKIDRQFEERTMPLALTLLKVEKDGMPVDRKRLESRA
jgi:hypothetical protein